ncbi:hypothetical protein D8B26_005774 [Coccidioides posadasii str. Silveira]|nr:hypothetical protein D8B26_005774 [Coccidioides posadasii str. Silveira]
MQIGEIAESMGFSVALSSKLQPMIKIVPRAMSAAADAYLAPVIKAYIDSISDNFDGGLDGQEDCRFEFMQSDTCPEVDPKIDQETGKTIPGFGYYETIAGGSGAGPTWHGESGVHVHMTNTRITDPEIFEKRYPVFLRQFSLCENSGGKGLHSGGEGCLTRGWALAQWLKAVYDVTSSYGFCHRKGVGLQKNGSYSVLSLENQIIQGAL